MTLERSGHKHMLACVLLLVGRGALAQAPNLPPVRRLGDPVATSPKTFRSISSVRVLPGGDVLVNDIGNYQLRLLDTSLAQIAIVADTLAATATQYGVRPGGLISYRGDSTIFVETATPAMYMIDPTGVVARALSVPNPRSAVWMTQSSGAPWAASDPKGRFIYRGSGPRPPSPVLKKGEIQPWSLSDTSPILRIDPATRVEETVGWYRNLPIAGIREGLGDDGRSVFYASENPLPTVEDFSVLSDGTIVILRGDFHLDLIGAAGARSSTPRIPYPWQRMSDDAKVALIDSLRKASEKPAPATTGGMGSASGAAGGGMSAGGGFTPSAIGKEYAYVKPDALPDYRPAFYLGALRVDAHDNLWIKTLQTASSPALTMYDVVRRDGTLIDRVELPSDRAIVGFDTSSVYLAARQGRVAWIERIRLPY